MITQEYTAYSIRDNDEINKQVEFPIHFVFFASRHGPAASCPRFESKCATQQPQICAKTSRQNVNLIQLRYSTSLTVVKASLSQTHMFLHIARQSLQINLTCLILIEDTRAIV